MNSGVHSQLLSRASHVCHVRVTCAAIKFTNPEVSGLGVVTFRSCVFGVHSSPSSCPIITES
eukprot:3896529-Rhodomonas_salina.1